MTARETPNAFIDYGEPSTTPAKQYRPRGFMAPLAQGWDWDRRGRAAWIPIETNPVHPGFYEVRGEGMPVRLREYRRRAGWDYKPAPGDEWRGLSRELPMTGRPYRPKRYTPPE